MIAMYTDSKEFWTIVVPQASWVYPQVRHAMTAISLTDQHLASGETNFDTELRVPKASYHYGQAIKGLMDDNACDKACMMATAMLLFTFEHINGDYNSSGLHFTAAVKIANTLQQDKRPARTGDTSRIVNTILVWLQENQRYESAMKSAETLRAFNQPTPPVMCSEKGFQSLAEADLILKDFIKAFIGRQRHDEASMAQARAFLARWQTLFFKYRYCGPEPLFNQRTTHLALNIARSLVILRDPQTDLTDATQWKLVISATESILNNEPVISTLFESILHILEYAIEKCPIELQSKNARRLKKQILGHKDKAQNITSQATHVSRLQ
ncbi:hypothetical protein UCRPC4_g04147 [Phaeomoniella chlamydospora]|uniref:Uncharacterized protein n=1 Tax=Phaeomoniella chlamydospora TaxID=158046 RepID=A0A0G2GVB6_PHACM|nr:hypothetical protein UCRPC4_g04147 [Phaeomoniella chlamydospora]